MKKKPKYLVVTSSETLGRTVEGFNDLEEAKSLYFKEKEYAEGFPSVKVQLMKLR